MKYLTERQAQCLPRSILDAEYEECNNAFERALVHMNKMPLVWVAYLEHLMKQKKITFTRHTFDRALRALATTQHEKWIWPLYLNFAKSINVPETSFRIWRRYCYLLCF